LAFLVAVLATGEWLAFAQDQPTTTLKLGTRLVTLSALVRDRKGNPVTGLTRDDFILMQDGKPQQIRYFSEGSDLPLTLALLVDTSGSQRNYIADEVKASETFFRTMLQRPEDRATLVQFDMNVLQLHAMTNSVDELENSLGLLALAHPSALTHHTGGTMLWDSIWLSAQFEVGSQPGRRALVVLTDGGDNGSRVSLNQAIAEAQRADTVIYPIFYGDENGRDAGFHKDDLAAAARATGGQLYTVSRRTPLETIYAQIANDMRLQYQLAYRPPESPPRSYHRIQLRPKNKKMAVQAREGYYSPN
jgi:Ca-activated chloride channel family protein